MARFCLLKKSVASMMQKLKPRISVDLAVLCNPAEFSSVDEYNNVSKSDPFWRQFSGEHLLMYQGDTIISTDLLRTSNGVVMSFKISKQ